MTALRNLYRRLDRMQHQTVFKGIACAIAVIIVASVFYPILSSNRSLVSQGTALRNELLGANLAENDQAALSLRDTGSITVDGRTYGGESYRIRAQTYFSADGRVVNVDRLVGELLGDQFPGWVPNWMLRDFETTLLLACVALAWLLAIVITGVTVPFLITIIATSMFVGASWLFGSLEGMMFFGGIGMLGFTYVLLVRLMLILMDQRIQLLAVAHTVIKESTRTKVPLLFVGVILVALPIFPFAMDVNDPLQYRVQTFISRSLGFTFGVAACLSLFLACATVSFEIRDRQIWQLMTKPVSRLNYLFGKWIGIMAINVVILGVSGLSVYTYIQYLRNQPVVGGDEGVLQRIAVNDEVLTARVPAMPEYLDLTSEQLTAGVDRLVENDPELRQLEEIPLHILRNKRNDVRLEFGARQRSVPPGMARLLTFEGLERARELNAVMTLRYRFHMLEDSEHEVYPARFYVNEDPDTLVSSTYIPTLWHNLPIGPDFVREDGTLSITIVNDFGGVAGMPPEIGSLNWESDDLQILYKVSSFESNFVRAMLVAWLRLAVLAAIGIGCATFLSFPVAVLLAATIFVGGLLGPFLSRSLELYYPPPTSQMDWTNIGLVLQWIIETVVRSIANVVVFLLSGFGELRPKAALVEGRYIGWSDVGMSVLKLGGVWSIVSFGVGYMVMRSRELATYSGHG